MSLLKGIKLPEDVRQLPKAELGRLVDEVRDRHIDVISKIGGHFGASLGVAELTVALHYVFDTPRDKLVWDTGHQGYIHKILTGRSDQLPTIRQKDGLAPFLTRAESEYDHFGAGHAATSISAALGTAIGRDLNGEDFKVVAIIGDGAMGCGLAYEALNNAGHTERDLIVVLNDNDMSIAPNVGAMNKYLTGVITHPVYNRVRDEVKDLLSRAEGTMGQAMETIAGRAEESVKNLFVPGMIFEELGFRYIGPVDGHDVQSLVETLSNVKKLGGPILVHVLTQKGKGFHLAEEDAYRMHAAAPFDKITGENTKKGGGGLPRYQNVFGRGLKELGEQDERVAVIIAGMPDGTSTDIFAEAFPDRFFDVGIAEAHGVTSAAGMATQPNVRPVVCIYSTFLQRGFDSIVHDVALQNLPVVFCMDRAGVAGPDGPTHHGIYDIAYMLLVPGMTITAPKDGSEMLALVRLGVSHAGPFAVRWPRDAVPAAVPHLSEIPTVEYGTWETLRRGGDVALLATGTMVLPAVDAAQKLSARGIEATVVNCRFIKPYDRDALEAIVAHHDKVITLEEGTVVNGFGSFMAREIAAMATDRAVRVECLGIPDRFIEHGGREALMADMGLDIPAIETKVRAMVGDSITSSSSLESA